MTLLASSAWLGLAWFAVVNLCAALLAAAILRARGGAAGLGTLTAGQLFALRLAPSAVAFIFTLAIFLPVHWSYEPADADEDFGIVIRMLALSTATLFAWSGWRAIRALRASARYCARAAGSAVGSLGSALVTTGLYGITLAGVIRTRVLVGEAARARLTAGELETAIAHERAQQRAHDNLKRFLMFCVPDLFALMPAARRLEAAWRAAAECQADAQAAAGDERRALDLAGALVKVARTVPAGAPPEPLLWSTFNDPPLLERRVRRLLASGEQTSGTSRSGWWMPAGVAGVTCAAWAAGYRLHLFTEWLVQSLP
jgi:hypothetical protein